MPPASNSTIKLPKPDYSGRMPVEDAIYNRESKRDYANAALTLKELSQILWAAGGVTHDRHRSTPSAGALYPLEFYVMTGDVEGIPPGVYHYLPEDNAVSCVLEGDIRGQLMEAALGQNMIGEAPATIVIAAEYSRTTGRYGERGEMYAHMEAGHAGQNIYLQAETLGLGTVAVGAFNEEQVSETLNLSKKETPLYLFPVGKPKA